MISLKPQSLPCLQNYLGVFGGGGSEGLLILGGIGCWLEQSTSSQLCSKCTAAKISDITRIPLLIKWWHYEAGKFTVMSLCIKLIMW